MVSWTLWWVPTLGHKADAAPPPPPYPCQSSDLCLLQACLAGWLCMHLCVFYVCVWVCTQVCVCMRVRVIECCICLMTGVQSAIVKWFFFWTLLWSGIDVPHTRLTLTDSQREHLSPQPLIHAVPDIKGTECLGVDMLANQGIIFFVCFRLVKVSFNYCTFLLPVGLVCSVFCNVPRAHGLYIPCA